MKKQIALFLILLGLICVVLFALSACEPVTNENSNIISKAQSTIIETSDDLSNVDSNSSSEPSEESENFVIKVIEETNYFRNNLTVKKTQIDKKGTVVFSLWHADKCLYEFEENIKGVNVVENAKIDRFLVQTSTKEWDIDCALIDSKGNEYVPFGKYGRIDFSSNSNFYHVAIEYNEDKKREINYIVNYNGTIIAGPYFSATNCFINPGVFDVVEQVGDKYEQKAIHIDEKTGKFTEHIYKCSEQLYAIYKDEMMVPIKLFYNAIKSKNRSAIAAVIGKERCDEAFALIDKVPENLNQLSTATKDEKMAWFIVNSEKVLKDTPTPAYIEEVHLSGGLKTSVLCYVPGDDVSVEMYITLSHDGKKFSVDEFDMNVYVPTEASKD